MTTVLLSNKKETIPLLGNRTQKDGVFTSKIDLYGPYVNRPYYFEYTQTLL